MIRNKTIKKLKFIFEGFAVITFITVLFVSCEPENLVDPQIKLELNGTYQSESDSFAVGDSLRYGIRCSWNGDDMLTRLFITTTTDTIEDLYFKPPIAGFGYDFGFKKTEAETDSIIVELFDTGDNIATLNILLHKKKKKKK